MAECLCCFCNGSIERKQADPVLLELPLDDGGTQALYAHLACLRAALHPSVPIAIFNDLDSEDA